MSTLSFSSPYTGLKSTMRALGAVSAMTLSALCLLGVSATVQGQTRLSDAEVHGRADKLLRQMTPEEKAGQLSQLFLFAKPDATMEGRIAKGAGWLAAVCH